MTMKVLTYLLVCAVASADARVEKPNELNKPNKSERRTNAHSTVLQKAFDRRTSWSPHVEAIHNKVQQKYRQQINGVIDDPDPRVEKRKERKLANATEGKQRILKKSKKSGHSHSHSGSSSSSSSSDDEDYKCEITITNLSLNQWFDDFVIFIHNEDLEVPVYTLGRPAAFFDNEGAERRLINNGLVELAQESEVKNMRRFYEASDDVYDADELRGPLKGGDVDKFEIEYTETNFFLSLATSLLFTNDGFVAVAGAPILDDSVVFVNAYDAGVEGNINTCWSVKANSNQFPPSSDCSDDGETDSDKNGNGIPGEGYVHVHRGIPFIDQGDAKDQLRDFIDLYDCDDDGNGADDFSEYFRLIGFDDAVLLGIDDDEVFINFIDSNDYEDDLIEIAAESDNFNDFCDKVDKLLSDLFEDLEGAYQVLEQAIFDWRNPIMKVEMECEGPSSLSLDD